MFLDHLKVRVDHVAGFELLEDAVLVLATAAAPVRLVSGLLGLLVLRVERLEKGRVKPVALVTLTF